MEEETKLTHEHHEETLDALEVSFHGILTVFLTVFNGILDVFVTVF